MNTIQPIIIPVSSSKEQCPKCHADKETKEVCTHCGYEYPEEPWTITDTFYLFVLIISILVAIVIFGWIVFTLLEWLIDEKPLLEVLGKQWEWVKRIRFK